jgi:hypothetical protein
MDLDAHFAFKNIDIALWFNDLDFMTGQNEAESEEIGEMVIKLGSDL